MYKDIYTVLMDAKKLPYLPSFKFTTMKLARDIMDKDIPVLVIAACAHLFLSLRPSLALSPLLGRGFHPQCLTQLESEL